MSRAELLLEHAAEVVSRRRREYVDVEPAVPFEHVAQRWLLTLGAKISPAQIVLCLLDVKIAASPTTLSTSTPLLTSREYAAVLREVTR